MVIYRSIPYEHSCPSSGCEMCKNNYQPPPANPRSYGPCCQYWENGEPVQVVICDVQAMTGSPRKRPGGVRGKKAATRSVTLSPARASKKSVTNKAAARRPATRKKVGRR
jgi:hypothetical protein